MHAFCDLTFNDRFCDKLRVDVFLTENIATQIYFES